MLHVAYLDYEGQRHWFASPDGERWLETNQAVEPTEYEDFLKLFNGVGKQVNPMKIHRNLMLQLGAVFL